MCRILLGNFLPFHGSPKSREGVGSRTMKTISSCPADSVQPPTDYGSSDCKPKSERWISQRCSARPRSIDLLNGHPYVLPPVCVCSSLPVGKNDCRTQSHNVRCSVYCLHCLVIIRLPTKNIVLQKKPLKTAKEIFSVRIP